MSGLLNRNNLKLIAENQINSDKLEIGEFVNESTKTKHLTISGVMMGAEKENKNHRIYTLPGMQEAVAVYTEQMIKTGQSYGELEHPESVKINYERATHRITELHQIGNEFYGKAIVAEEHPMGRVVAGLLKTGGKVGMSSRALGELVDLPGGIKKVVGMHLVAIDCVSDPSYSSAYVNGILESASYNLELRNGIFVPVYENFEKKITTLPIKSSIREEYLTQVFNDFMKEMQRTITNNEQK